PPPLAVCPFTPLRAPDIAGVANSNVPVKYAPPVGVGDAAEAPLRLHFGAPGAQFEAARAGPALAIRRRYGVLHNDCRVTARRHRLQAGRSHRDSTEADQRAACEPATTALRAAVN